MAGKEIVTKRVAISKANAQMVGIVGAAAFVTIFCLVAAKAVWGQNSYQARVISAEDKAKNQLAINLNTYANLSNQYNNFVSNSTNVLGGQSSSSSNNGGDNSKIILDALPPTYDFPALASSIAATLKSEGINVSGITGTDDQLTEQTNTSSANPTPVNIPFSFSAQGLNYQGVGSLLNNLQRSVRPISIDSISVNGGGNNVVLSVTAHTYYQPAKSLGITEQEVK